MTTPREIATHLNFFRQNVTQGKSTAGALAGGWAECALMPPFPSPARSTPPRSAGRVQHVLVRTWHGGRRTASLPPRSSSKLTDSRALLPSPASKNFEEPTADEGFADVIKVDFFPVLKDERTRKLFSHWHQTD